MNDTQPFDGNNSDAVSVADDTGAWQTLRIACSTDDNYCVHMLVMLLSLLKSHPESVVFDCVLLDGNVSESNKTRIATFFAAHPRLSYRWVTINQEQIAGLMNDCWLPHLSTATLLRLFLPKMLPDSYDKILYLDSDIIINGDLRPFYNTRFDGNHVIAVQDMIHPFISYYIKDDPIAERTPTFNAGVMVMNLALFRQSGGMHDVLKILQEHSTYSDQEGLNTFLIGKWKASTFHYNVQSSWMYPEKVPMTELMAQVVAHKDTLMRDAAIFHFTGPGKPWNSAWTHPFRVPYEKLMLETGWYTQAEWFRFKANRFTERVVNRLRGG